MLQIDGGRNSGSGTIVRDAVSIAALTGQEVHIRNIRKNRPKPGLRSQHLKGVEACCQLCHGKLENARLASRAITFLPGGSIAGGEYSFTIGTAGSTILLTSTLLPVALFCDEPVICNLTGGLFQDFAPSAFHMQQVLLPLLRRMGADVELTIKRPGYYPRGQGEVQVRVQPLQKPLQPIRLLDQGEVERIHGIALSSLLQEREVSDRMATACRNRLKTAGYESDLSVKYDTRDDAAFCRPAVQPGAALAIWTATTSGCLLGSDRAGALRRSAERIGTEVADNLIADVESGATVDRFLADQLIPFCALAEGTSEYLIPRVTEHVTTRLWLIEEMLAVKTMIEDNHLTIEGVGFQR